ncbi:17774_t:CDS:2 [Entrophospora sp. SA101]|nr:17774_t:CDS:2 [Entrophospora sp. SA101]
MAWQPNEIDYGFHRTRHEDVQGIHHMYAKSIFPKKALSTKHGIKQEKQVVDLLYSCYKNKSVVFIEEKDNAWYPYKHEETGKTINIAQEILISLRKKMGNSLESEEEDYSVLMNEIYNELITNQTYGKSYRILIQKVNNSNNNNNNNNNSLRLSHSV